MAQDGNGAGKPKILLAEDNPVVRKGAEHFLAEWGYETIVANDGDAAWRILEEDRSIRLAIVDWNMPGLSGIQICQRLRTRTGPYVYTIIFSARKSYEAKIMALDGGADDYLVKPCKPSELRARLGVGRRIVETAMSPCPAQPPSSPPEKQQDAPKDTPEEDIAPGTPEPKDIPDKEEK
ncbi:MAG: response regulator transcription factor [Deltaproteobacteria bacterium]|nr:response regulator transcription factor [Deltaproteobacteria bacterium]